jgi:hypothetical protein
MKLQIFTAIILLSLLNILSQDILIDHNLAQNVTDIDTSFINKAKSELVIKYYRASHGSHLTSGMSGIAEHFGSQYSGYNITEEYGRVPDDVDVMVSKIKSDITENPNINVIMYAWCKFSGGTVEIVNKYLSNMSSLESEYPNIKFVYMTGRRNQWFVSETNRNAILIREYCNNNNKILFDYTDIQTYSPDGVLQVSPEGCCTWEADWCANNPGYCWYTGDCEHCGTGSGEDNAFLNCQRMGTAAWYLWASLVGWDNNTNINTSNEKKINSINANIVNTNLNIDIIKNGLYNLTIIDSKGRKIHNSNLSKDISLNLKNIIDTPGLYIIEISKENKSVFSQKISWNY